ncbi:MAG TPA: hypothetical protein VLH12_01495 [Usitatibacter sp.]|nr:hypothetical protein [Usitatibacter sp.]
MSTLIVVIIVISLAIGFMVIRLRAAPVLAANSPRPRPRPSTIAAAPAPVAKARIEESPASSALDWDVPVVDIQDVQRAKIRGRYLAARFPGVARSAADLLESERIIHSARLYFEDRKSDRAIELLDLAIAQCPADPSLSLARLEIAFLIRDAVLYVALAGAFRAAHPSSPQWPEVARLGRTIAPQEAMFGASEGPRDTDHYGPWPDMPNWIQAPWDLTAEVRATEFHQAMARHAA